MSRYCFIASDDAELPYVNHHPPDEKGRIIFNDESELGDLRIEHTTFSETYEDVKYYTKLSEVYDLNFTNDEKRVFELIQYLQLHVKKRKKYEVYQIWLANARNDQLYKSTLKDGLDKQVKGTLNVVELTSDKLITLFNKHESLKIKIYREGQ